jgi:hypothetical protein
VQAHSEGPVAPNRGARMDRLKPCLTRLCPENHLRTWQKITPAHCQRIERRDHEDWMGALTGRAGCGASLPAPGSHGQDEEAYRELR